MGRNKKAQVGFEKGEILNTACEIVGATIFILPIMFIDLTQEFKLYIISIFFLITQLSAFGLTIYLNKHKGFLLAFRRFLYQFVIVTILSLILMILFKISPEYIQILLLAHGTGMLGATATVFIAKQFRKSE